MPRGMNVNTRTMVVGSPSRCAITCAPIIVWKMTPLTCQPIIPPTNVNTAASRVVTQRWWRLPLARP